MRLTRLSGVIVCGLITIACGACLTISVKSPDGQSTASYSGTSIIGGEDVSCGTIGTVVSCSGSGQNVAGLAQAIAPYLGQLYGIPVPPAPPAPRETPTATPTPAPIETPIR